MPSRRDPAADSALSEVLAPAETHSAELEALAASPAPELSEQALASSTPFLGRWNELVSTTNWEKGRIIAEWRDALSRSGAHVSEFSDEAWARLVGGVTSQHVGRLRRAHERFGAVREQYPGLYWSHFQAALDWDDAEMWLEGALSSRWSVSQMRGARWEAHGGAGPEQGQVVETQLDEDSYQALVQPSDSEAATAPRETTAAEAIRDAEDEEAPFEEASADDGSSPAEKAPRVRPFADLAKLPDDVAEAFEQFKLVILSHKLTGWEAISRDDLVGALEALKALALAPSEE